MCESLYLMKEILYNVISKCYIEREDYQQRHQDNILIIIGIVIMGDDEASMSNGSVYNMMSRLISGLSLLIGSLGIVI